MLERANQVFCVNPDLCDMYKFPAAIEGRNPYSISIGAMGPAGEVYAGSKSLSSATNLQTDCKSGQVNITKPSSFSTR